jgi:hypothetical protein
MGYSWGPFSSYKGRRYNNPLHSRKLYDWTLDPPGNYSLSVMHDP